MTYSSYTGEFYGSLYERDIAEARAKSAVAAARGGLVTVRTTRRPVTVTTVDEEVDAWGVKTTTTTTRRTDEWGVTTTRSEERKERRAPVRRYSSAVATDEEVAVATGLAVGLGGIALCAALFGGD